MSAFTKLRQEDQFQDWAIQTSLVQQNLSTGYLVATMLYTMYLRSYLVPRIKGSLPSSLTPSYSNRHLTQISPMTKDASCKPPTHDPPHISNPLFPIPSEPLIPRKLHGQRKKALGLFTQAFLGARSLLILELYSEVFAPEVNSWQGLQAEGPQEASQHSVVPQYSPSR